MYPIKFEQVNKTYIADGCNDLPVFQDGTQIHSCWKLTFKERLAALFFGKIWLTVHTKVIPPVWLGCMKTIFINKK